VKPQTNRFEKKNFLIHCFLSLTLQLKSEFAAFNLRDTLGTFGSQLAKILILSMSRVITRLLVSV